MPGGPEMNVGLDAKPVQIRAVAVAVPPPGPGFGENLSPLEGMVKESLSKKGHSLMMCGSREISLPKK